MGRLRDPSRAGKSLSGRKPLLDWLRTDRSCTQPGRPPPLPAQPRPPKKGNSQMLELIGTYLVFTGVLVIYGAQV
jgi:hypothetical protein